MSISITEMRDSLSGASPVNAFSQQGSTDGVERATSFAQLRVARQQLLTSNLVDLLKVPSCVFDGESKHQNKEVQIVSATITQLADQLRKTNVSFGTLTADSLEQALLAQVPNSIIKLVEFEQKFAKKLPDLLRDAMARGLVVTRIQLAIEGWTKSQRELARLMGVSSPAVSNWFSRDLGNISGINLVLLEEVFSVSPTHINPQRKNAEMLIQAIRAVEQQLKPESVGCLTLPEFFALFELIGDERWLPSLEGDSQQHTVEQTANEVRDKVTSQLRNLMPLGIVDAEFQDQNLARYLKELVKDRGEAFIYVILKISMALQRNLKLSEDSK